MTFIDISGNKHLIEEMKKLISSGKIHHAYIIEGPFSVDKMTIAKAFVQGLICKEMPGIGCGVCAVCKKIENENYIDLNILRANYSEGNKTTKSVKDEDIISMISRIKTKPYEGDRNIVIIEDADTITLRAQNRLLKTLEEPPIGTVIILLSENISKLEQTIISRCVHFRVFGNRINYNEDFETASKIVKMISGKANYCELKPVIEKIDKDKLSAYALIDSMEEVYHEELVNKSLDLSKDNIFLAIEKLESARRKIQANVGIYYALKQMILEIGGK